MRFKAIVKGIRSNDDAMASDQKAIGLRFQSVSKRLQNESKAMLHLLRSDSEAVAKTLQRKAIATQFNAKRLQYKAYANQSIATVSDRNAM
jgi:hypothetical protein